MALRGRSKPVIMTIVSRRAHASRGVLACSVVSEPSWPVFMACSMSSVSGPRHSPMMMRSGRIRRAFFTRSVAVMAPLPSMFAGRVFDRDDALVIRNETGKCVKQRRFARARAAGNDHVEASFDRALQEHDHF